MIKILNKDFKDQFTKRELSPLLNITSMKNKKDKRTLAGRNELINSDQSPTKSITNMMTAVQLT